MQIPTTTNLLHALSDFGQGFAARGVDASAEIRAAVKPTAEPETRGAVFALGAGTESDGSFQKPPPGQPVRRGMFVDIFV